MSALSFLEHPVILAPMEGVGHPAYRRRLAEQPGIGMLCTEFVRVHDGLGETLPVKLFERSVVKVEGVPLSVQVMGKDVERMAEAAEIVEAAGADVVDINLGCPTSKAVKGGVGSAMLKDLVLLAEVLSAMREKVRGRLSAKIRAGFETAEHALEIADVVENAGCDFIAVHPRKRSDQFRGVSDWRIIREIKAHSGLCVIGNGDVWYAADVARMMAETGCDAVMIGRPAIRNPWIFRQAMELRAGLPVFSPSGEELATWLEGTVQLYRETFKASAIIGRTKELLRYVGRTIDDDRAFLKGALRLQDTDEILRAFRARFAGLSLEEIDLGPEPRFHLERSGSASKLDASNTMRSSEARSRCSSSTSTSVQPGDRSR